MFKKILGVALSLLMVIGGCTVFAEGPEMSNLEVVNNSNDNLKVYDNRYSLPDDWIVMESDDYSMSDLICVSISKIN